MQGMMMNAPLNIRTIMAHAEMIAADQKLATECGNGTVTRTYRDTFKRVAQLAHALDSLGLSESARIGTLAWNDFRHFELHYAAPCTGRICHTINPKLFPEQIRYIINDAQNEIVFVDAEFLPVLEKIQSNIICVKHWVVLGDMQDVPTSTLPNMLSYETLISNMPMTYDWPELDENTASNLCYTSGTTGDPKGVLGTHRSIVLQCLAQNMASQIGLTSDDVVMPLVPMFHVNAWCMPYSAPMSGAGLVLPGRFVSDSKKIVDLINSEQVTFSLAVPTVWNGLLEFLKHSELGVPSLKRGVIGGAAGSRHLYAEMERQGVVLENGWGMTELSPVGTYNRATLSEERLEEGERLQRRQKSGRPLFGLEMRIVDEDGNSLPHDGATSGVLEVHGPTVCAGYFGHESSHGWFNTGDVATIDQQGYMQITDRVKDVIKSGGEWISSIEIENVITNHPAVKEAVVIGVYHQHWSERPLLIVVPNKGYEDIDPENILKYLADKIPKWWIPNKCELTDTLPHTATGKISKKLLRESFSGYTWQ